MTPEPEILVPDIVATVCFLMRNRGGKDEVLLAWKEPTPSALKLGVANKWNGYGGKQEQNESVVEACVRELFDETGGVFTGTGDVNKVAEILFWNTNDKKVLVHYFVTRHFEREPKASAEMSKPTWFTIPRIPLDEMMDGDRIIIPVIMSGRKLRGMIRYGGPIENQKVVEKHLEIVASFD